MRTLAALVGLPLLVRILVSSFTEPTSLETYTWMCGRYPAAGYYDYPAVAAWTSRLSTALCGSGTLGMRAAFLASAVLFALFAAATADRLYGRAAGIRAAGLASLLPVFFAYGALALPDAPLLMFWAASVWAATRALTGGSPRWWAACGAFAGGAMASKYGAVLLAPGLLLFLALSSEHRPWLRRKEPWIGVVVAAVLQAPTLAWNAAHEWRSFAYQGVERFGEGGAELRQLYAFPLNQLLLVTPGVAVLAFALGGRALLRRAPWPDLFLAAVAAPTLALFAGLLFFRSLRGHWTAPAYVSLIVLAAGAATRGRTARWVVDGTLAALLACALLLPAVLWRRPAAELRGWSDLARHVAARRPDFVIAQDYHVAAQMAYHLRPTPAFDLTPVGLSRKGFSDWFRPGDVLGRNAVLLYASRRFPGELERLRASFDEIGEPERVTIAQPGGRTEEMVLLVARGYRGPP